MKYYDGVLLERNNPDLKDVLRKIAFDEQIWQSRDFEQWKIEIAYWLLENFDNSERTARERIIIRLCQETVPAIKECALKLFLTFYARLDNSLQESLLATFDGSHLVFTEHQANELFDLTKQLPLSVRSRVVKIIKAGLIREEPIDDGDVRSALEVEKSALEVEMTAPEMIEALEMLKMMGAASKVDMTGEESASTARAKRARSKYKTSISHPKLLSKWYASLFVVQIYLPSMRSQATKTIMKEFETRKIAEHVWDVELEKGLKIRITLSSPVLSFSDPVIKQVENDLTIARFTAIPNDDCWPGTHYAILSITNAETQFEYESISFSVQVVDFAFDHVSRPFLSKATSAVLGLGSLAMFALTALEQVDKTFGLTAGTAAAVLTSTILVRWWSLFQQPKVTHTP